MAYLPQDVDLIMFPQSSSEFPENSQKSDLNTQYPRSQFNHRHNPEH